MFRFTHKSFCGFLRSGRYLSDSNRSVLGNGSISSAFWEALCVHSNFSRLLSSATINSTIMSSYKQLLFTSFLRPTTDGFPRVSKDFFKSKTKIFNNLNVMKSLLTSISSRVDCWTANWACEMGGVVNLGTEVHRMGFEFFRRRKLNHRVLRHRLIKAIKTEHKIVQ